MPSIAECYKQPSAHWYTPEGQPLYEVPRSGGEGMRPTTLADARKLKLCPSVTTVEQILDKPALNSWKVEQGILAGLRTERLPGESDEDFATRIAVEAESISEKARDLGSAIHQAIDDGLAGRESHWPEGHEVTAAKLWEWVESNLQKNLTHSEQIVTHALGYGGKVDAIGWFGDDAPVIIDWKTQGTKPNRKINAYDSWGRQLAAYGKALDTPYARLINVVLSTTEPGRIEVVDWSDQREKCWRQFKAIFWLWCLLKDYWPGGEFDIAPVDRILADDQKATPANGEDLIAVGQIAGLRQLASGEGRVTLDIPPEAWPSLAVRGRVGTMARLEAEANA